MSSFGEEFIGEKAYEKFVVTLWPNLKGRTLIMSYLSYVKKNGLKHRFICMRKMTRVKTESSQC